MSSLSIEKTRKECFVSVGRLNCFGVIVRSFWHITECRLVVSSMLIFMTDNILFSYISMFPFLVRLFAVFLLHFQLMSGLDIIKTIKKKKNRNKRRLLW